MMKNEQVQKIKISLQGRQLLENPSLNKGTAFTEEERTTFHLHGLLPPRIETLEEQALRIYQQYQRLSSAYDKNIFLNELHDSNETLFYYLTAQHLQEMLPIIYTPTIAKAVEQFSVELRNHRGLFISYTDRHRMDLLFQNIPDDIDLVVVTDGEGVLGIGDQGAGGMRICIGKLMVYTLCAGINPHRTLAIQLDIGTNNEKLLNDPFYLGLRQHRISSTEYDEFIALFVQALQKRYPRVFLHWEDFKSTTARKNLDLYRQRICSFNDDMQGTGVVTLACLLSAVKSLNQQLSDQKIVILGAGTAGTGIADQIIQAMVQEDGISIEKAQEKIWLVGRNGLLLKSQGNLSSYQTHYAKNENQITHWVYTDINNISLLEVVQNLKPSILIGTSTVAGAFNEKIVKAMASAVDYPIIMPLSNPTANAEAIPKDLLTWTNGKALIATGSPFDDVIFNNKRYPITQSNNAFAFPGIGLGILAARPKIVTDNMLLAASFALAELSPRQSDLEGPLLPSLSEINAISQRIAYVVAEQAIKESVAEPIDIKKAIEQNIWQPRYLSIE